MACPICQKRKANRLCPAKAKSICSTCCGREREVTIDCPSDCTYLVASRQHDHELREIDRSAIPFADVKISRSFVEGHGDLLMGLVFVVCAYARKNAQLVDSDVIASIQALAETYRTLSSGLLYERPPDYRIQRDLYEALKIVAADSQKQQVRGLALTSVRQGDIRDVLIFLAQLGATRTNGRPKSRAYLDFLRGISPEEVADTPASRIVMP